MHPILEKLLRKRGIDDLRSLSSDEKETFDKWGKILSEGEITVEKIEKFCEQQIGIIQEQYSNPDNSDKKDIFLKACLNVYSTLLKVIKAPEIERSALEKYLLQMLE